MGAPVVHFEISGTDPQRLSLGGKRVLGPERSPGGNLVVGHFTDPEGHLIGVAGPAPADPSGG